MKRFFLCNYATIGIKLTKSSLQKLRSHLLHSKNPIINNGIVGRAQIFPDHLVDKLIELIKSLGEQGCPLTHHVLRGSTYALLRREGYGEIIGEGRNKFYGSASWFSKLLAQHNLVKRAATTDQKLPEVSNTLFNSNLI